MKFAGLGIAVLVICVTGCGGDGKATVNGTITFNGQPIPIGTLVFVRTEGGLVREGAVIKDGAFRASLPTGNYKVEVNARKVVGKTKAIGIGDPVEAELTEEMIPERYNTKTELTAQINSATHDLKLELHGKR